MACDRQTHPLYERAQGLYERAAVLYERAAVLYESAAAIFRLPYDRSVFAEALSKEPPVRCELAELACEDTVDRSEAIESPGQDARATPQARTHHEHHSQVLCKRAEVTGRLDGDRCPIAADQYARSSRTRAYSPSPGALIPRSSAS
jgi:hypothetical protein